MKIKIDNRTIASLALARGQGELFAWDTTLEGFALRLRRRRSGGTVASWVAQYRTAGRTRRVLLGSTEKLTASSAREAAKRVLARAALGHDPQGEKQAKRHATAHTWLATAETYLEAKRAPLRPASYTVIKLYLTGRYFKPLHGMPLANITHADLAARLTAVTRDHSEITAAAARRAASAFLVWCVQEGLITNNPIIGTRRPAEPAPRARVLTDVELVEIWKACGDDDFGKIMQLLILLGSRRGEVAGMRWSEINLEADTWTLPAARSKNARAHTLPLVPAVRAIIDAVPRGERDQLFGRRADRGFASWGTAKQNLDRTLGDSVGAWRVHDIRRTVATRMADIGIEPHVIEAVLNHWSGHRAGVAGIYNRSPYEAAVRRALIRWAEHVLALVEGREDNVVAFG
jgi:integrase